MEGVKRIWNKGKYKKGWKENGKREKKGRIME